MLWKGGKHKTSENVTSEQVAKVLFGIERRRGPDCPDDELFTRFCLGDVPPEDRRRLRHHLLDCGQCELTLDIVCTFHPQLSPVRPAPKITLEYCKIELRRWLRDPKYALGEMKDIMDDLFRRKRPSDRVVDREVCRALKSFKDRPTYYYAILRHGYKTDCPTVRGLARWICGELSPPQEAETHKHVTGCPACLEQLTSILYDEHGNPLGDFIGLWKRLKPDLMRHLESADWVPLTEEEVDQGTIFNELFFGCSEIRRTFRKSIKGESRPNAR